MPLKSSKSKPRKSSTPAGARRTTAKKRRQPDQAEEAAWIAANSYCLCTYGMLYTGSPPPRRLTLDGRAVWIVPVVLTSPGYGIVGEVGVVAVDALTLVVVGGTPRPEVLEGGRRLCEEKRDELDAAFHRARKV
jgi:hypothetical protein